MNNKESKKEENIMNTPKLETERLILRKFEEMDLPDMLILYRDEEVNRFLPWFPMQTQEEMADYLHNVIEPCYDEEKGYSYAVVHKAENRVIGYVHVNDLGGENDIGYAICREFWNQGLITEACRAVICQMKKDGVPYVTAIHDRKNPGSGRVMQKLGMMYQYSYEEQWQPKDFPVIFRLYQLNLDGNEKRIYTKYWDDSAVHFIENLETEREK